LGLDSFTPIGAWEFQWGELQVVGTTGSSSVAPINAGFHRIVPRLGNEGVVEVNSSFYNKVRPIYVKHP